MDIWIDLKAGNKEYIDASYGDKVKATTLQLTRDISDITDWETISKSLHAQLDIAIGSIKYQLAINTEEKQNG